LYTNIYLLNNIIDLNPIGNYINKNKMSIKKTGLVRLEAWKLLLNLPSNDEKLYPLEIIKDHPEYHQVDMDVRRCLKRFPPYISYEKIVILQKELIAIILSVIKEYPDLKYYQVINLT